MESEGAVTYRPLRLRGVLLALLLAVLVTVLMSCAPTRTPAPDTRERAKAAHQDLDIRLHEERDGGTDGATDGEKPAETRTEQPKKLESQNSVSTSLNPTMTDQWTVPDIQSPVCEARRLGGAWVRTCGMAELGDDVTYSKARWRAQRRAWREAVYEVVGAHVSDDVLMIRSSTGERTLLEAISSQAGGVVVDSGEPVWSIFLDPIGESSLHPRVYVVVNQDVEIERGLGTADPAFSLSLRLNRSVYQVGDIVELAIVPTLDCYLTVWLRSSCDPDRLQVLCPSRFCLREMDRAGVTSTIPDARSGHVLRADVISGYDSCEEEILVVGLKNWRPLPPDDRGSDTDSGGGLPSVELDDFLDWIAGIPGSQRVIALGSYLVSDG